MLNGLKAHVGRSYAEIEDIARRTRDYFGVGEGAADCLRLFEHLHEMHVPTNKGLVPVTWAVADHQLPSEGLTAFRPDLGPDGHLEMFLREDVYQDLRSHQPRARFTFAHELGHVVLHAQDLVANGQVDRYCTALPRASPRRHHKVWDDTEWQANAFAGAFLMPARELDRLYMIGKLNDRTVAKTYIVSSSAAQTRIDVFMPRRTDLVPLN